MIRLLLAMRRRLLAYRGDSASLLMQGAFDAKDGLYEAYDRRIAELESSGDAAGVANLQREKKRVERLVKDRWFDELVERGAAERAGRTSRGGTRLGPGDVPDLVQDIIVWLWEGKAASAMMGSIEKRHPDKWDIKATDIMSVYKAAVMRRLGHFISKMLTDRPKEQRHRVLETESGSQLTTEDVAQAEEQANITMRQVRRLRSPILREVTKFDNKHGGKGLLPAMFEVWWGTITKPEMDRKDVLRLILADPDVRAITTGKGTPFSRRQIISNLHTMNAIIEAFVSENIEAILTEQLEDALNTEGRDVVRKGHVETIRIAQKLFDRQHGYMTPQAMAERLYADRERKKRNAMACELLQVARDILNG